MHMNKVLVAGILGLMLTACGQKIEEAASQLRPRPQTLLPLSKKPLKRLLPSRRLLPKLPWITVEKAAATTWPPRLKLP